MSNEEIQKNFDIAPIWMDWYTTILKLNAEIILREKENIRNIPNYIKTYGNTSLHPIHYTTISNFKIAKINTSAENNKLLYIHWFNLFKDRINKYDDKKNLF